MDNFSYALAYDPIPDGLLIVSPQQTILYANPIACEMLGYPQLTNQPLTQILANATAVFERQNFKNMSCSFLSANQVEISACLSSSRLENNWLYLFQNITKQNQREQQLRDEAHAAQASDQRKTEFLAVMNHEIRLPLTSIIGMSEILSRKTDELPKNMSDTVYDIQRTANTLSNLISNVLDISRMDSGHLTLETAPFCLADLIDHIQGLFGNAAKNQGIDLNLHYSHEHWMLQGDLSRLQQVLTNLVSNALKFTQQGRVKISIDNRLQENKLLSIFTVADTGKGIHPNQITQLFQPYQQLQKNHQFGSSGLGLWVAQQLVTLMGGKIEVTSTPKVGSVFCFSLHFPILAKNTQPEAGIPKLSGRVLVVDDIWNIREYFSLLVEDTNAEVDTAIDGKHAVEICLQKDYDLILMDMNMPGMNGLETMNMLRDLGFETPIVAITGYAEMLDGSAQEMGYQDCLSKPVNKALLYQTLSRHLNQHGQQPVMELSKKAKDRLKQSFEHSLSDLCLQIDMAHDQQDLQLLQRHAHALKGLLRIEGSNPCLKLAEQAEQAERGVTDYLAEKMGHLSIECRHLLNG
jgi:two-component system, sensor histidine kinase